MLPLTRQYPDEPTLAGIPAAALHYYQTQIAAAQGDLSLLHNAFIDYSILLLQFSSLARPVNAMFSDQLCLDVESGLLLLSDKVVIESRPYRLMPLTSAATHQWKHVIDHLQAIITYLDSNGASKEVIWSVKALLCPGTPQKIPLLFHLSTDLSHTVDVTKGYLDELYQRVFRLPSNVARSIFATEAGFNEVLGTDITIALGHAETLGVDDPFGKTSLRIPTDFMGELRNQIHAVNALSNWDATESPLSTNSDMPEADLTDTDDFESPHNVFPFGIEARAIRRVSSRLGVSGTVRACLGDLGLLDEQGKISAEFPGKEVLEDLRELVEARCDESGQSRNWGLRILYVALDRAARANRWPRTIKKRFSVEVEPSPFNSSCLVDYRRALDIRSALLEHFHSAGKDGWLVEPAHRIAEFIIWLALRGVVTHESRLGRIHESIANGRFYVDDVVFIEIPGIRYDDGQFGPSYRIMVDEMGRNLLVGYWRAFERSHDIELTGESIAQATTNLIQRLAPETKVNPSTVWSQLAKLGQSASLFEMPGLYREMAKRSIPHRTLKSSALGRVLRQQAYKVPPQDLESDRRLRGERIRSPKEKKRKNPHQLTASRFSVYFGQLVDEVKQSVGDSNNLSDDRKALLARLLSKFLAENKDLSFSLSVTALWCIRLCRGKTVFGNTVVFRTVVEYTRALIRIFRVSRDTSDMEFWSSDQFEDFYSDLVESNPGKNEMLAGRLYDFDAEVIYVRPRDDEIDWSSIFVSAGGDPELLDARIDADIVTEAEYQASLEALLSIPAKSELFRYQVAFILILGFRYGLRWSEAFFLQVKDIQYDEAFDLLFVTVRPNKKRSLKSAAARRRVPLIGILSPLERKILEGILRFAESWRRENKDAYFASDMSVAGDLITEWHVAQLINSVLKLVSGNKRLRFHHCRHTMATRIFVVAFLDVNSGCYREIWRNVAPEHYFRSEGLAQLWTESYSPTKKLRSITCVMGHRSAVTTAGYVHCHEALLRGTAHASMATLPLVSVGYILGVNPETLRRARSRWNKKYAPELFDPNTKYNDIKSSFLPFEVQYLSQIEESRSVPSADTYLVPDILVVHDMLLGWSRLVRSYQEESKIPMTTEEQWIYSSAQIVEERSGYTRFGFYRLSDNPMHDILSGDAEAHSNLSQDIAIRNFFSDLTAPEGQYEDIRMPAFHAMLGVWEKSYTSKESYLIMESLSDLDDLLEGLNVIGLGTLKWELLIPEELVDITAIDVTVSKHSNLHKKENEVVRVLSHKGGRYQSARIGLRLRKRQGKGSPGRDGLNRILFTLAVWETLLSKPVSVYL